MSRAPRVRTGCITCKNRKVKCDEAKPDCNRCASTGRHCDGYITVPNGSGNPVRLLLPRHVSPVIRTTVESRALQFFFHVAGPSISGGIESSFWAHVVMRSSTSELAVKHAVVAISSLYEVVEGRYKPDTIDLPRRWNTAIQHYNAAIRELRTMDNYQTLSSVLLVCALFVCIEVLCDNRELAVQHCRHGLRLLRSGLGQSIPIQEDIISAFRRLSVLLFYFGDDWDVLSNTRTLEDSSLSSFSTLSDAEDMLDVEVLRTARLVYQTAPYRSSLSENSSIPQHLLAEQASINRHLDVWSNCILNMKEGVPGQTKGQPVIAKPRTKSEFQSMLLRCFLLTHYECCRIWVNMAFSARESDYDRMYPNFRRALDYLLEIGPEPFAKPLMDGQSSLAFTMDNGFGALLFFLLTACRHLPTRLEFLRLLPIFMHMKEKFWERNKLIKTAKNIIEAEHGIQLNASDLSVEVTNIDWPPEHMRISSMWAGPGEETIFILKIHSNHSEDNDPSSRLLENKTDI